MQDDLTDSQHDTLVAELHALEASLRAQLSSATGDGAPVELDTAIGRISRVDAIQQQQMVKATRQRAEKRLTQVRAALGRVDEDAYGECCMCGDPIGFGRLHARPETPLCVQCQGEIETRRR